MLNDLAMRLLNATRGSEVVDFLEAVEEQGARIGWKPVGGNDNNLAIINLGSDPAAGVVERITNAFDAVMERTWLDKGQPAHLRTPRSAAEEWFGIREGRLANLAREQLRKFEPLSSKVTVTLRDSELINKPTVDIRDEGIGLSCNEFGDTILSLNKNRKLRKLFLAGAFGQGGSTALAYSNFTIIFSKKADDSSLFAFTVVRFNPGDPNIDKHGLYEYAVDRDNGFPFTANIGPDVFKSGTLVRHIAMDVGKYNAILTAPTGSLWFLAHNYLFDPVLPFSIEDRRRDRNESRRTVTGNNRLLTQGEKTEYQRSARLTFREGVISLYWWVLSSEGDSARDRLKQYAMVSKPIIVTFNGQKQGDFPNSVIKDDLKLPYLDRYLVVHVDCDNLDAESRRQLFPTTREALRDTPIGDDLRRLITETLQEDDKLRELDQERKRRFISSDDLAAVENIRRRLANRVSTVLSVGRQGAGPRVLPPVTDDPPPVRRQPIPIQDPPTFIRIVNQNPIKVYSGRTFTVKFETDANPALFNSADNFLAVINAPTFGQFTGTANVRQGHGVAYFKAAEGLEIDTEAKITLEVRPPRSETLSDSVQAKIADLPQDTGGSGDSAQTPNINPRWVTSQDGFWSEQGWNKKSVAAVRIERDAIDIWVSAENERLNNLIVRAQRRDVNAVDAIKAFYLEHVCYFALLEKIENASARNSEEVETDDPDGDGSLDAPLRHACDTVCGIIDDMFEIIVTNPVGEAA